MTAHTTTLPTAARHRAAIATMWGGLALTVVATVSPFVDNATTRILAGHIEASYPSYGDGEIDVAVGLYLVILSVVGGVGILSWLGIIWATATHKRWAAWAATLVSTMALCLALAGLAVRDTSGDVGLAPLLGWLQVLPCVLGLVAVVLLWRGRR